MKATYLGTGLLAVALALAGCGGTTSFTISGSFYDGNNNLAGVKNAGLVLANGTDEISIPVGASTFSFPQTVDYGDNYNVVVKSQPLHMTCTPQSTAGVAGRTESIVIPIKCVQNTYVVYVTVKGLTEVATGANQLVLINGSTTAPVTAATPTTNFPGIPVGTSYGITIFQQPAGQTCTVTNGSGIMGDADRADTVVNCQKNS